MDTTELNKEDFEHVWTIHNSTGIDYQKKWLSAKCICKRDELIDCYKQYEELGFVQLDFEYSKGVLYPSLEICHYCIAQCYCRIIFKVIPKSEA